MRLLLLTACCLGIGIVDPVVAGDSQTTGDRGPSTTTAPFLQPLVSDVSFVSLLTSGDVVGQKPDGAPWRMVGFPDGLGAFDNGDGTITVLMNHEVTARQPGAVRAHGANGAFVSRLVIDKASLRVVAASDLATEIHGYDPTTKSYAKSGAPLFKLCSGDLAAGTAFYDPQTGRGYQGRIFMSGEEVDYDGRAFAHFVTGPNAAQSWQLPALGRMAFENLVAHPAAGEKTIVGMMDDSRRKGEVYFYVGEKQAVGDPVARAGLANGRLYAVRASRMAIENADDETSPSGAARSIPFEMADLGDVSALSGAELDASSKSAGATAFFRPEDGAWDRVDPNRFYFNTTADFNSPSRVWALDFRDFRHPEAGGALRLIYQTRKNDQHMLDNMTVTKDGLLILQEDPGETPYLARIHLLDPRSATPAAIPIATHDPALFGPGGLTTAEESSGVLDVTELFGSDDRHTFLLTVQAHEAVPADAAVAAEVIEAGQLLLMRKNDLR